MLVLLHLLVEKHSLEGAQLFRGSRLFTGFGQEECLEETVGELLGLLVFTLKGFHDDCQTMGFKFVGIFTPMEPVAHQGGILLPSGKVCHALSQQFFGWQFVGGEFLAEILPHHLLYGQYSPVLLLIVSKTVHQSVNLFLRDIGIKGTHPLDIRLLGKQPGQEPLGLYGTPFIAQLIAIGFQQLLVIIF